MENKFLALALLVILAISATVPAFAVVTSPACPPNKPNSTINFTCSGGWNVNYTGSSGKSIPVTDTGLFPVDEVTNGGSVDVIYQTNPNIARAGENTTLHILFEKGDHSMQNNIDYQVQINEGKTIVLDTGKQHTISGDVKIPFVFHRASDYQITISVTGINNVPILTEYIQFDQVVPLPTPEFPLGPWEE